MKLKALIPVRSGSERIQNKNIRSFAGSSLLELKIKQMKRVKEKGLIDGVVVNSNDDQMLELADKLGVETVKRDEYYAQSLTPNAEIYHNYAQNIECDVILLSDATNPLIKDDTICKAIDTYFKVEGIYDSLATASPVKLFMWKNGYPINYDENNKPRSQDLPNILALNFALHIIKREFMEFNRRIIGFCPYLFEIEKLEGLDIDELIDFEIAEFLFKKYHVGGGG